MKRILLVLLTLGAMSGLAGTALAQGTYAGISFDFRSDYGAGLFGHLGSDNLSPHFGIRADLGLLFSGGTGFELGANALYHNRLSTSAPLELYAGGGPRIIFAGGTGFALGFLGGLEYAVNPGTALYGEFGVDVGVTGGGAGFGLGFGANFYM